MVKESSGSRGGLRKASGTPRGGGGKRLKGHEQRQFPSNFKDLLPRELEVSCGDAKGTWHSARFKRGHKSKCILYLGAWISPVRFTNMDKTHSPQEPGAQQQNMPRDWKDRIQADGSSLWSLFVRVRQCKGTCKCTLCSNSAINETSPSPEASLLPPTPLRPPQASKGDSSEASSDSGLSLMSTLGKESSSGRERLLDLNAAVQKALTCLEGQETSRLHILLFILHYYDVEPEDVSLLNKRLKRTLQFLTRMDVLQKGGDDPEDRSSSGSEEEDEDMNTTTDVREAPKVSKKPRKLKDPSAKVTKKPKLNTKENKVRKPVIQKPKNLSPALSSLCGGVRKLSRHDVVRRVWVYIKKRNLQDAERKNIVKCDDKLRELSNEDEFHFKNLFRYLDSHMS